MALSFGQISFLGAIGLFGAREIERKLAQRRDDPRTFRETPVAYAGGAILALGAAGLAARLGGASSPFGELDEDRRERRRRARCRRRRRRK